MQRVEAAPVDVVEQLAHLANVPTGVLRALLDKQWQPGDEVVAEKRIADLRCAFVKRAAEARRKNAKHPQRDVKAVVDELILTKAVYGKGKKKKAFEHLAKLRNVDPDTIRNAYYSPQRHDDVITPS